MATQVWQLKQDMCDIGYRIWLKGFCAGNEGNHSVRISDDRVLCTPTGLSKGFLKPEMICTVDMDGNQVDGNTSYKRTSEVLVHLAIYKHRPDVTAVIHSHPPHATAFAISGIPLPEGIHPEAEVFLGRVPTADYATPSTQALPDSITPLIGAQTNTVLMGNHGSVSFSTKGIVDAFYKLEILDAYCRVLMLTRQLGRTNVLDSQQMTELLEVKKRFGFDDERLDCAPDGCVGEINEPFFAHYDVRPMSAVCGCDGQVTGASSTQTSGAPVSGDAFEAMVQTITDQIMESVKA
ncbi:MAG: aldolase [Planctomycetaceae bacterium]|nr:aldolase [Planctomycetaceae bacterium]